MFKRFSDNQEAFASSGELAPTRLGMAVEEQWPAFKLVGFGFYYAWIWVSYNSNVLVSPAAAYDLPPDTLSLTYLVSTLALGLSLIALALARDAARRVVASNGALGIIAVVVGLATVGTYASSSLGVEGNPLLIASAALTGIGTSAIVLRFGVIYAKAPAREATMYTAASFVFAMMIYFVAVGLPDPVGGGVHGRAPRACRAVHVDESRVCGHRICNAARGPAGAQGVLRSPAHSGGGLLRRRRRFPRLRGAPLVYRRPQ